MFINDLKMQGSNAVAESTDHKAGTEASRDCLFEAKQDALDADEGRASGVTGCVADKVKDGARKAVETAERTRRSRQWMVPRKQLRRLLRRSRTM